MIKNLFRIIHDLRHAFFLLIVLGFFFVVGINPISVGQFFGTKLGRTVGMSVSVPDNPFNSLARQLEDKEQRLAQKELALATKEREIADRNLPPGGSNGLVWFLTAGIILLFILILLNYYLDYRRRNAEAVKR